MFLYKKLVDRHTEQNTAMDTKPLANLIFSELFGSCLSRLDALEAKIMEQLSEYHYLRNPITDIFRSPDESDVLVESSLVEFFRHLISHPKIIKQALAVKRDLDVSEPMLIRNILTAITDVESIVATQPFNIHGIIRSTSLAMDIYAFLRMMRQFGPKIDRAAERRRQTLIVYYAGQNHCDLLAKMFTIVYPAPLTKSIDCSSSIKERCRKLTEMWPPITK